MWNSNGQIMLDMIDGYEGANVMQLVNCNNLSIRKCAFCKNWYDPMNASIQPKDTRAGFWMFDSNAKAKCMLTNIDMPGFAFCGKFVCKI